MVRSSLPIAVSSCRRISGISRLPLVEASSLVSSAVLPIGLSLCSLP